MRVVCCRCEKWLDTIPVTRPVPGQVSHGLCQDCAAAMLAELDAKQPVRVPTPAA